VSAGVAGTASEIARGMAALLRRSAAEVRDLWPVLRLRSNRHRLRAAYHDRIAPDACPLTRILSRTWERELRLALRRSANTSGIAAGLLPSPDCGRGAGGEGNLRSADSSTRVATRTVRAMRSVRTVRSRRLRRRSTDAESHPLVLAARSPPGWVQVPSPAPDRSLLRRLRMRRTECRRRTGWRAALRIRIRRSPRRDDASCRLARATLLGP